MPTAAELIQQQADANRITQFTPQGNLLFGEVGAGGNFVPRTGGSASVLEESPFSSFFRQGGEDILAQLLGQANTNTNLPGRISGLDFSSVPDLDQDFSEDASRVEQATFGRLQGLLDPVFDEQQRNLNVSLANRGLPTGSEIRTRELGDFRRNRANAFENAALSAVGAGRQEQSRLFGLSERSRNAEIQSQLQNAALRNTSRGGQLNEIFSILGGGSTPGLGSFFSPSGLDITGPNNFAQNAQIASDQNTNNLLGGLIGLGGSLGGSILSNPGLFT